jgi:hypothetical protein
MVIDIKPFTKQKFSLHIIPKHLVIYVYYLPSHYIGGIFLSQILFSSFSVSKYRF